MRIPEMSATDSANADANTQNREKAAEWATREILDHEHGPSMRMASRNLHTGG